MFRYSVSQWIFGNEDLEESFRRLQKYGYEAIEFAAEPALLDPDKCLALMQKYGIGAHSLCGLFNPGRDLTAEGEAAGNAVRYLRDSVDFAAKVGVSVLIVVPSPVGRTVQPDCAYERLWENAVRNIREAADHAQALGVTLAVEAVNRYETYFVNTLDKAYRMVREIAHPAVGIMADTFHMNIEERDMGSSLRMIADKLVHVHLADNTREPPGCGNIDFGNILRALHDIGYKGTMAMEFMPRAADPYSAGKLDVQSGLMDICAGLAIGYMKQLERSIFCA